MISKYYADQIYLKLISFHNMVFLEELSLQFLGTAGSPINMLILLFVIILVGGFVGVILAVRKGRKPAQESEELKDYEDKYLAKQGIESTRRKPAETRESESNFCDNCGKSLRPTAKFCGKCGSKQ